MPALKSRPLMDRLDVARCGSWQGHLITAQARSHRRIEGVGNAWLAKQIITTPAKALAATAPDGADSLDVCLHCIGKLGQGLAARHIHRQMAAQCLKAGASAAEAPAPQLSSAEAERLIRSKHARARILLVEDNLINQEVALELLRGIGLQVDLAGNGKKAVAMASETAYDLILMDIQMPIMDGLTATRQIRASAAGRQVPILAMTANAFGEDRLRCLEAGMNDHVAKPVDPGSLYTTLVKWLRPNAVADNGTTASPAQVQTPVLIPSETAQATIAALEKVPGLDSDYGLKAMRGKLPSYLRLLGIFVATHGNDDEKISAALSSGNIEQAELIAHGLKGVSGSLGLKGIYDAALSLDDALRDTVEQATFLSLVATLGERLKETTGALSPILAAHPADSK